MAPRSFRTLACLMLEAYIANCRGRKPQEPETSAPAVHAGDAGRLD